MTSTWSLDSKVLWSSTLNNVVDPEANSTLTGYILSSSCSCARRRPLVAPPSSNPTGAKPSVPTGFNSFTRSTFMLRSVLSKDVASDSNSAVVSRPSGFSGVPAILEVVVVGGGDDPGDGSSLMGCSLAIFSTISPFSPSFVAFTFETFFGSVFPVLGW